MSHRIKSTLTTLAVTGALVGGGAAIASAATSSTTSTSSRPPATTSTSAHSNGTPPGAPMPGSRARAGAHHCPGMSSGPASAPQPGV